MQIVFYFYDKSLILKCFLILSNTNTKIWSKNSMGPYVAKMFFLQSKQMKISGYTGVWYKNYHYAFQICSYGLVTELRKI